MYKSFLSFVAIIGFAAGEVYVPANAGSGPNIKREISSDIIGSALTGVSSFGTTVYGSNRPEFSATATISTDVPSFTRPSVSVPSITIGSLDIPSVTMPSVSIPSLSLSSLSIPTLSISGSAIDATHGVTIVNGQTLSSSTTQSSTTNGAARAMATGVGMGAAGLAAAAVMIL